MTPFGAAVPEMQACSCAKSRLALWILDDSIYCLSCGVPQAIRKDL